MDAHGRRSPARHGPAGNDAAPLAGETYLEYISLGHQVRVNAIDAATGTEVTVFGPSSVSQDDLGRIAARKLARRLERAEPPRAGRYA